LRDPILKKPITKRVCGVVQGEDPEFKPFYPEKNNIFERIMLWKLFEVCSVKGRAQSDMKIFLK
jgi:hypothetical protein